MFDAITNKDTTLYRTGDPRPLKQGQLLTVYVEASGRGDVSVDLPEGTISGQVNSNDYDRVSRGMKLSQKGKKPSSRTKPRRKNKATRSTAGKKRASAKRGPKSAASSRPRKRKRK